MDAVKIIKDARWRLEVGDITREQYKELVAPLRDVEVVRRGRWIIRTRHEHYPSGRAYEEIVCPFCGKVDHNGDGNFCGYCGAKADRGEGEENVGDDTVR